MNELALFAGAGGGLLATKWLLGWRTVCYVENASYPVSILQARIRDGYLDDAPIWSDVRTFDGRPWSGCVDIVTAGFPCQPFSRAGKGLAERDERNLWPDTIRIIREVRPEWILLENVARLLSHAYVRRIYADVAQSGYDIPWDCIPASAVGANHQRDRLWIVAHASEWAVREQYDDAAAGGNGEITDNELADADEGGFQEHASFDGETQPDTANGNSCGGYIGGCGDQMANTYGDGCGRAGRRAIIADETRIQTQPELDSGGQTVADADRARFAQPGGVRGEPQQSCAESCSDWRRWWEVEPDVGRMADGLAARVDRLAAIGEGQVPAVVAAAWGLLSRE